MLEKISNLKALTISVNGSCNTRISNTMFVFFLFIVVITSRTQKKNSISLYSLGGAIQE